MKTLRLFLFSIFMLCCSAIYAYDFKVDGIYYNIVSSVDKTVKVTYRDRSVSNQTAYSGEVVIPGSVVYNDNKYKVVGIDEYAFYYCSSLSSIELPEGVTSIGDKAFNGCSKLDRIYLLSEIPFTYNSSLAGIPSTYRIIIVPETAVETYQQAEGWSDIAKYITGAERMTQSIEVTASNIGSAVRTAITDALVEDVVDLTIKGTINSYDIIVLNHKMPILQNLDLSEAQIVNSDYPYYDKYCTADSTITSCMFRNHSTLRSLKFPKKMKGNMGEYVFYECINLRQILLPEGITSIGSHGFYNCKSLTNIAIPNGITSIGSYAFSSSSNVSPVPIENIILPQTVTSIGACAFSNASRLKNITLSPNLITIGSSAFSGAAGFTEIRLPSSLKSIGLNAFYNVSTLKKVYTYTILPLTISDGTFSNAANAELYLPETSSENYYFAPGWNGFLSHTTFNEPYEYFYLNGDKEVNDDTGFIEGDGENKPDADINAGGGIIVGGDKEDEDDPKQPLGDVNVENDGNGNSGSMIGNGNLVVDRLHMKITVKGGKWYFFSFPFDVDLERNVWMENGSKFVFRYYDGEDRAHGKTGWKNITEGELKAGQGYIFQCSANDVLVLKRVGAQFSKQPVYKELSAHASENEKDASWNFMGNPYLSYYDMNEMEFTAPVTVWDGTKYVAVRPGDDDYHFTPYEAFFVQKPEGTNEVGFDGEKQMTQTQSKELMAKQAYARKMMVKSVRAKENPRKLVNLTLTAGEETDGTRIVFNEAQSRAYEADCDAAKFETQGVIQLFTIGDQKERYAINERPADNGIVVLGFTAPTAGEFTISATRMDTPVYLKDTETGALVDLSKGGYNFTAKAGTYTNRFEVLMEATVTGIQQVGTEAGEDAKVYDLSGRRAKENSKGVYIINGEKTLVK